MVLSSLTSPKGRNGLNKTIARLVKSDKIMDRTQATKFLRDELDKHGLKSWHVRLTMDLKSHFLGLCSYVDKCIILNAFHIDTHGDLEVINTIKHEVAHALVGAEHGHDEVWAAKAKEIGCDIVSECAHYGFNTEAINAIRSGADLIVEYEEQLVRTPKYRIQKIQERCPTCNKVAVEKSVRELKLGTKLRKVTLLQCGHTIIENLADVSPFETITFDGDESCKHIWNKTICTLCNAKRLYDYQIVGAQKIEQHNGNFAVFDEMGLGKTIQALAYLKFHPEMRPFLWVTKAGTIFQHGKEIVRMLGMKDMPWFIQTSKDKPQNGMNCLASYDIFKRIGDLSIFDHFKIVILDECQAIKNPDSSRTQTIRKIVRGREKNGDAKKFGWERKKVIPLSGTFWKNRISEAFVTLNMLDPKSFGNYNAFKNRWENSYFVGLRTESNGIRNPSEFMKTISHVAIRRERKEVMPELPLINRTVINCEVPEYARKIYQEEENKIADILKDNVLEGKSSSFTDNAQVQQSIMIMKQIVGIAKVPSTVDYAKEFLEETDRKLVIFVHHKKCQEMIFEQLSNYCKEEKLVIPLQLTASLSSEERFNVAERFKNSNARIMIASTLAAGEGINLQFCSDCIMHERQWNPANEMQAEGRFIRIGQKAESVNAIYVHATETVDTIFHSIVETKRKEFENAMNQEGYSNTWNEAKFETELIKQILANRRKN